jgi:hypothetical protein
MNSIWSRMLAQAAKTTAKKCGKCRYFHTLCCPYPDVAIKKDTSACASYKKIYLRKLEHKPLEGKEE